MGFIAFMGFMEFVGLDFGKGGYLSGGVDDSDSASFHAAYTWLSVEICLKFYLIRTNCK